VRALLDLVRENGAGVQANPVYVRDLLRRASKHLTILDPELGQQELVKFVAAELAKLTALIAEKSQRQ
jgi:hypothetical protein